MRATTAIALVLAAGNLAHAQPRPCEVTYARAPEEARRVIEAWVAREQRCSTTLELRVIPTDGGLYLYAQDAAGHVRERIVPDADAAGTLVASWVADDSIGPPIAPPAPAPVDAPVPV